MKLIQFLFPKINLCLNKYTFNNINIYKIFEHKVSNDNMEEDVNKNIIEW